MIKLIRCLLYCCPLFWLAFAPLQAEPQKSRYVVGVENIDYYPQYAFSYRGSYAEALLSAFAQSEQIRLLYNPLTVDRLYQELLVGENIDFKYPDSPDWGLEHKRGIKVHYSDGVSVYLDGVYVRPERLGLGVEQLKTLGLVQGFTPVGYEQLINEGKVRMVEDTSLSKLLLMCLRGELDGVYANTDLSHYWLTHTIKRPHGLVFDAELPYARGEYRLSSVLYPDVIERFNEFLKREQPLIDKLRSDYGIQDKNQPGGFR